MVGTFYRSPAPDADPFLENGDTVDIGQTVVASPLNIERSQIEPPRTRRTEQKVPHAVDHLHVDLLGIRRRQVFEHRIDAKIIEQMGIEKRLGQRHFVPHRAAGLQRGAVVPPAPDG